MQITFTLSSTYTGATYVAGPFNISGTTSAGTTYQLATGVTKSQLTTGHSINTVYETLTGGTIQSTGGCSTSQPWYVVTPSPTSSGTYTANSLVAYSSSSRLTACSNPANTTVYFASAPNNMSGLQVSDYLYSDSNGTPVSDGYYYKSSLTYGIFRVLGGSGQIAAITDCTGALP